MSQETIIPVDSLGAFIPSTPIPVSSLTQTFTYSGGFVTTASVSYLTNTYVQTFTNDGTNITLISGWVKQ